MSEAMVRSYDPSQRHLLKREFGPSSLGIGVLGKKVLPIGRPTTAISCNDQSVSCIRLVKGANSEKFAKLSTFFSGHAENIEPSAPCPSPLTQSPRNVVAKEDDNNVEAHSRIKPGKNMQPLIPSSPGSDATKNSSSGPDLSRKLTNLNSSLVRDKLLCRNSDQRDSSEPKLEGIRCTKEPSGSTKAPGFLRRHAFEDSDENRTDRCLNSISQTILDTLLFVESLQLKRQDRQSQKSLEKFNYNGKDLNKTSTSSGSSHHFTKSKSVDAFERFKESTKEGILLNDIEVRINQAETLPRPFSDYAIRNRNSWSNAKTPMWKSSRNAKQRPRSGNLVQSEQTSIAAAENPPSDVRTKDEEDEKVTQSSIKDCNETERQGDSLKQRMKDGQRSTVSKTNRGSCLYLWKGKDLEDISAKDQGMDKQKEKSKRVSFQDQDDSPGADSRVTMESTSGTVTADDDRENVSSNSAYENRETVLYDMVSNDKESVKRDLNDRRPTARVKQAFVDQRRRAQEVSSVRNVGNLRHRPRPKSSYSRPRTAETKEVQSLWIETKSLTAGRKPVSSSESPSRPCSVKKLDRARDAHQVTTSLSVQRRPAKPQTPLRPKTAKGRMQTGYRGTPTIPKTVKDTSDSSSRLNQQKIRPISAPAGILFDDKRILAEDSPSKECEEIFAKCKDSGVTMSMKSLCRALMPPSEDHRLQSYTHLPNRVSGLLSRPDTWFH